MKKWLLLSVLFFSISSYGQRGFERTVLREIGYEIQTHNNEFLIREQVKNLKVCLNLDSLTTHLDTIAPLEQGELDLLEELGSEKVKSILEGDYLNYLPLDDEFLILDTIGFFGESYDFHLEKFTFKVVNDVANRIGKSRDYLVLNEMILKKGRLGLSFATSNKRQVLNFTFTCKSRKIVELDSFKIFSYRRYYNHMPK